ncbi:hypothetical protein WJX73_000730 [Symbiochloris irregularis]|uniref:Aminotransferase class I/classII large domain-containing protein n=1 Tax=Symbiochloris irregularis TaxID=706552 RepID=A0AAW1PYJ2_9CHLO
MALLTPRAASALFHLRSLQLLSHQYRTTTPLVTMTAVQGPVASTSLPQKPLNTFLNNLPTTVFSVMTELAIKHQSVNLGQGFPDDEGPESMKRIVGEASRERHNQYPPTGGIPELRQAVARHSERYVGLPVNWQTETLITVGATEALAAAFLGLVNPGDEVIIFDPQYDSYSAMAVRTGATVVPVPLDANNSWRVPGQALAQAFSPRTKLILVNSPHNPTGAVFHEDDLREIARLCVEHDVIAICDEVYEHQVFGDSKHVSLRAMPEMRERAIRIGSAGKTFSLTGWKVGWVTGPARLIQALGKAHMFVTFTVAANLQLAVAHGLDKESSFYEGLSASLQSKKDYLAGQLQQLGFEILPSAGTYFLVADFSGLAHSDAQEDDVAFAKRLTVEAGVTTIPVSAFYNGKSAPHNLIRFCFCKTDQKLQSACERLQKYFGPPHRQNGSANGTTNSH